MIRPLQLLRIAGMLLGFAALAQGATPPPGTIISNTATATFTDSVSGYSATLSSNTVSATVIAGGGPAAIAVTVSAASGSSTPAATVNLTSIAANSGGTAAYPVSVTVNGAGASLFLLSFPVPANTSFAGAQTATAGAQTLYHLSGTAANSYATTVPAGATVDAVAWAMPALAANSSLVGQFAVTVNGNASGSFSALATAAWASTPSGAPLSTPSNALVISLPVRPAAIAYFSSASYSAPRAVGSAGAPLFVQLDAAACNVDPTRVLTVPVSVTSQLTGDIETFAATETAPDTGLFRVQPDVPTADATTRPVASGDGVLEVLRNDVVTANVTHCGSVAVSVTTTLLIDPSGVVFDSRSNAPVAGVTVQLIDVTGAGNGGNPGAPGRVLRAAGGAGPATVVTGADGVYAFPIVPPSTYRLVLTPPGGEVFPSRVPPAQQPAGRVIDPQGSYGNSFIISGTQSEPVRFDVPLDRASAGGLLIHKSADRITAEVGDFVDYTVQINNASAGPLAGTLVNDLLPAGFSYVRGSARLNGAALPDPAGGAGPALQFSLGILAQGAQATLSYRVRLGVGAQGGSGVNSAQAVSGSLASNRASAAVQVVGGVFDSKAYLIGKVFADCSGNGVQDPEEPGVPGVRIYLEDGTYAVTDEQGKYSLYGLIPRLHVAKVDATTLPAGTRLEVLGNRNALDANSAFVDLTNGELHKTDFGLAGCPAGLREQIEARRQALKTPSEILQLSRTLFSENNTHLTATDARTAPASGTIQLPGATPGPAGNTSPVAPLAMASGMAGITPFAGSPAPLGAVADPGGPYAPQAQGVPLPLNVPARAPLQEDSTALPTTVAVPATRAAAVDEADVADFRALRQKLRTEALEQKLPALDASVAFVNLSDGEVLGIAQTPVQVKGPLGTHFEVTVNGTAVPRAQVGKMSSLEKTQVVAWEYIGVNLAPGRNRLAVRALDEFGTERGSAAITVLAPGELAHILIEAPPQAVADAATVVTVTIRLRDANDLPVSARTPVTLSTTLGRWQRAAEAGSVDSGPSGNQVFVTGGALRLLLLPPAQPGKAELGATSGVVKATAAVEFTPNLRPLIGVGLVAGTLNLRNLSPSALQPAQSGDVFEREIQSVSRSFDGGKDDVGARTALFLKGKVLGSTLLTLAYDSDKPSDTTLFRDIQPDQFYPVYGDSSARGFDAQSTGKLYVMVQNGTNYVLYGDYSTQSDNPARQLTQYARALNGGKGHWQFGSLAVDGFASDTSSTQSVIEFRANGTSGPFQLDLRGVTNSQQVDVITRDRNQPGVILNDTPLTAFADYAIEPYTGLLLLKNPAPSVDANLNPVYIHVSYSIDTGGPKHWVEGADARVQVTPRLALGATAIHDADPLNHLTLEGVNATEKFDAHTTGTAEVARSSTDLQGSGLGERLDLQHSGAVLQAHVWGVHTDADFYNPNSLESAGASQYGVKAAYKLDERDRLVAESQRTSNGTTGAEQTGAELKLERVLPHNAKLEAGLRYSSANAQAALAGPTLPGAALPLTPAAPLPAAPSAASSADAAYTSVRAKVTVPVPEVKGAEAYALAEQAIDGSGGREDAIGGTYAVNATTRIYAQHDFINSLNGPYTLNPAVSQYSTVAGIATTLPDTTQLFEEYRVSDSMDGRSSEAAIGLRRQWKLPDDIGLSASLQRINPLSGVVTDAANAITLGASYTPQADWKASGQAQWQTSSNSHSWLLTAGLAHKLDASWTLLERALFSRQTELAGGGGRELARVQSGFAFRPVDSDVWNALGQVEYKRDFDATLGPGLNLDEQAWIVAGNLNIQPTRRWQSSARYAAKRALDWSAGFASHSLTQLAGARSTLDLSSRWDAGVQGYRMWGDGATEYAIGANVGYLVWKNLWLSLGYNVKGFDAPDLAGEAYTQRGVYLRLSFKFDESLFAGSPLAARAPPVRAVAGRQP